MVRPGKEEPPPLHQNPLSIHPAISADAYQVLADSVVESGGGATSVRDLVSRIVSSKAFVRDVAGRVPIVLRSFRPLVRGFFTVRELLEGADAALAAGVKLNGGVSYQLPNGRWEYRAFGRDGDPKLREAPIEVRFVTIDNESDPHPRCSANEVKRCLSEGTVFVNDAPTFWPQIAQLCAEATLAVRMPASCNIYVTSPGRRCSNPVHTDHHDVVILQTQGSKRFCVYWPPAHVPRRDPFSRGKGGDLLGDSELHLAQDVTLQAGDLLYIPAGFPHSPDTWHCEGECTANFKSSVHLTLHWSSHAWYLDFANLRTALLIRAGGEEGLDEGAVPYDALWGHPGLYDQLWPSSSWTDMWPALLCRMDRVEPGRSWNDHDGCEHGGGGPRGSCHLRRVADQLLRNVDAYRQSLVRLQMELSAEEVRGFGAQGAAAALARRCALTEEMSDLKESLLAWVNASADATGASQDTDLDPAVVDYCGSGGIETDEARRS